MKVGSLRFKINAAILLTSALIAVIYVVILYPFETARRDSYVKKVNLLLDAVFSQRKEDLANELFARQRRALAASLEDMLKVEGIVAATVFLPDGEVFLSTDEASTAPLTESTRSTLNQGPSTLVAQQSRFGGRSLGVYSRSIEVIGMQIGFVQLFYDLADLEKESRSSVLIFLTLLTMTILLMIGVLNLLLSRFVIKPVSLLRKAIHNLREGHLGETIHLSSRDEVGEVGGAFNEMSVELERGQIALAQAEEKYRGIFENAIEGIFQSTPGKGQYLTVNPSMVKMLGYDSREQLLVSVFDIPSQLFVNPADHEEFERILLEQGHIVGFETRLYRKDGSTIWVSASARSVCGESGAVRYFEGSFIDVTERREKEKAERERQTAEAASRAKSEFLANMSHEIRTPMNAILGFSDLLGSLVVDPRQKNYLESIQSSGKSLMSLINDILDLSKIEAGRMEIHYGSVSLRSLFDELGKIFSLSISDKGLDLITYIAPSVPESISLDEVRLRQVLFNLLGNAVKFTEEGFIRLSADGGPAMGDGSVHLTIAVEDTGIGIQSGAHSEIFESFKQQSGQDAKLYGGTGLGLTISKSFVEMMGGSISVRSRVGKGSVFEIHLPSVSVVEGFGPLGPLEAAEVPGGMRVTTTDDMERLALPRGLLLVVDDNELNRRLVRELLQCPNMEIMEAANGQMAVASAREYQPDLILMDIRMPFMDGYEAARRLKEEASTREIPIIALTASCTREEVEEIQKSGFDGWLLRPFNRSDLLGIVSRFIRHDEAELGPEPGEAPHESSHPITPPALSSEEKETVLHLLDGELMQHWATVRLKQRIADIEELGYRIRALGERYGIALLSSFADSLLFHVGNFDIENIQRALGRFPELVDGVRDLYTGEGGCHGSG